MIHYLRPGYPARMKPVTIKPLDVSAAARQLAEHPELWNTVTLRTQSYVGTFKDTDDIWLRSNAQTNYDPEHPEHFVAEHHPVWYPAYHVLTELHPLIWGLMPLCQGEELGTVLITRILPGGKTEPHVDRGWCVEHFNRKFAVMLEANKRQNFCFEGETIKASTGEVFEFDNRFEHWVTNDSDEPRTTLIVCIHKEGA